MLYDTTLCIGCKACVVACTEANGLEPDTRLDGIHQAPPGLNSRTKNVIKLYKDGERRSYMKAQCMHCVDPACAGACMLGSLKKDEVTGVVTYNPAYCVGCRYCMMSCPFNVAKFEFEKALPKIVKCELCSHRFPSDLKMTQVDGFSRFAKGQGPACCEVCPRGAVIYGKRAELLAEAKRRIAESPGRYQPEVYGETDGGGTQVLYLSHVPFDKLGLPKLGGESVPHTALSVQHGIYKGFIAPVALYAALGAVMIRNRKKHPEAFKEGEGDEGGTS
jgi:Fe-S-cluster-containing dehydrogenase component